ncbi:MAG: carbohydrate ABC transporter permease [Chthoniobacterales bacterium]
MFFSPISERTFKVRSLYLSIYLVLIAGGLTMIIPFIVMLSGSVEPTTYFKDSTFFPKYFVSDKAYYKRYIESKYGGTVDNYRMATSDSDNSFRTLELPKKDPSQLVLWQEFLKERGGDKFSTELIAVGFIRSNTRLSAYNTREFRHWLVGEYGGDMARLNSALNTQFSKPTAIRPTIITLFGSGLRETPLMKKFAQFVQEKVPDTQKYYQDAGGYYRAVFLPRVVGPVENFNATYGTSFYSYSELPFSATLPDLAPEQWTAFVKTLLRPNFIELTESGNRRMKEEGMGKENFIRLSARPEELRVNTVDRIFAEWAEAKHGVKDARIPQQQMDAEAAMAEKSFWKFQFATLNYLTVFDEVFLYGRAVLNTFILVLLCVGGALLINPLAAYALSRFKLPQTYSLLVFFLATIAFPAEVTMIPVFLQLRDFNLLNTFGALVLPGLVNGFSIFLLKGFFDSLPRELYEAAELDGASEFRMFWQITMNLSKPILAVIALAAFVSAYSTFFFALILAPDPKMWTIMVYIFQLRAEAASPIVYASLIVTAIPTLLVFIFCQNIILRGIVVPSDK